MNKMLFRTVAARASLLSLLAAALAACGGSQDPAVAPSVDVLRVQSTAGAGGAGSKVDGAAAVSFTAADAVNGAVHAALKIDPRLRQAQGPVEVWVSLSQPTAAQRQAALLEISETKLAPGEARATLTNVAIEQTAALATMTALGAQELGRVTRVHNAVAVKVDAGALPNIAAINGVRTVRPVVHSELALAETVPYVGAKAAQDVGKDGRGVRVAVLDSGIDYTHAAFGGPGTPAAFVAAGGDCPPGGTTPCADTRGETLDGLFPTAKVVGGYDFVGPAWPVGARSEDPDPIDRWGHGTNVAHIVGGAGGVAPAVALYAVKVCSAVGTGCNGIAQIKGMDFALDPNGDGDIDDAVDVINLSLGANYGQAEDDMSEAVNNAVRAGVIVVAAAGNGGDKPYIIGSPASAPGAIAVAQTAVPSAVTRILQFSVTTPTGFPQPTQAQFVEQPWAPLPSGGVSGDVVYVGRGCPAGTVVGQPGEDPYLASPAGKIALVDRGSCAATDKVDRAARAGATAVLIGFVTAEAPFAFAVGGGSQFVPTLAIAQVVRNNMLVALGAGQNVSATLRLVESIAQVGTLASTSSRGPSMSKVAIKPEIGAPGASVSALIGSGTGTRVFGGTSGASPMVAGAAAILRQAYPDRSPLAIKALLMNSADPNILTTRGPGGAGALAPITRIGAGELRVNRALALETAAWVPRDQSAALSFGYHAVSAPLTLERVVRVRNFGRTDKTFGIASSFRYANDEASGAVVINAPPSVSVPARGAATFTVTLTIDPARLPAWGLTGGAQGGNGALLQSNEFDGYITLTSGPETLSLPWHVLPKRAPTVTAAPRNLVAGGSFTLANASATNGVADVFALTGVSPRTELDRPRPGENFAVIDIRAVGLRPVVIGGTPTAPDYGVQFAFNTFGARAHPNYPAVFIVQLDTNRDGTPDFEVFNQEVGGFGATGQNAVFVQRLGVTPLPPAQAFFFTNAQLNSANVVMTVPLAALGLTLGQQFDFVVGAADNYFTGAITDEIGLMTHTLGAPRFASPAQVAVAPGTAVSVPTTAVAGGTTASPSQLGLLLMYASQSARDEAQVVRLRDPRPPRAPRQ